MVLDGVCRLVERADLSTPIQNNIEELYSLFRFLRAKPLDDWNNFRDRIAKLVKQGQTKVASE
jgi:SNF2 family DNA or RNA helicase